MIAGPSQQLAVRDVRAVLADRVLDDATVVVEDGRIVSVGARGAAPPGALDGRGAFCLPGVVDTHSDGLEKEVQPRPGVPFPLDFALGSFEGRARAAGVTTIFHGVAFEQNPGETRTVELAEQTCAVIERRRALADPLLDHRILHRLDARDPAGFDALRHRLATHPPVDPVPLVSFEDHTPGQGQYADPAVFSSYLEHNRGISRVEADAAVVRLRTERDARLGQRRQAIAWLADRACAGAIRLLAHDPATAEEIDEAAEWGVAVAEFPTSVDAAVAAREAGMATVMGAPNVLRGGSHSGNVAAEELVARGLCTGLASDYLPSTLLAAAFHLARLRTAELAGAVALVTSGPAAVAGLTDRGRLAPGQRADLLLVTVDGNWPTVRLVLGAGEPADRRHRPTTRPTPSSDEVTACPGHTP